MMILDKDGVLFGLQHYTTTQVNRNLPPNLEASAVLGAPRSLATACIYDGCVQKYTQAGHKEVARRFTWP